MPLVSTIVRCCVHIVRLVCGRTEGRKDKPSTVTLRRMRRGLAQRNYASMENLQFFIGSSENIPAGTYDAVFSNHAMHWIKDKETAFRNVFDNLKVNGKFAINCAAGHITKNWKLLMNPGVLMYLCTSDELKKIAVQIGFEVEFESVDKATYTFESIEKYADWIISTFEIAADTIDPVKMEEFKKECEIEPQFHYNRIMIVFRKIKA